MSVEGVSGLMFGSQNWSQYGMGAVCKLCKEGRFVNLVMWYRKIIFKY